MAAGAYGYPLRHRVGDAEASGKQRGQHGSFHSRDDHGGRGDAGDASPALRDAQRDGCGDTLRQHGGSKHLLGAEQPAQQQHGAHAGGAARQTPCQHGEKVFPQHLPLLIDIQGQHRGGRAQHQLYQPAAGIVALQGDA